VETLFHPFQPFILGQKNLPPKIAARFDIPLVFYGENEAEYGNPRSEYRKAQRDGAYYVAGDQTFLSGVPIDELVRRFGLERADLQPYVPPDPRVIEAKGIDVRYLGYYLKWHPQSCYYYSVEHGGFIASPERTPGTYSKYNSIDDKLDDFHYLTTHIKFGIGRATYDSAQEVRSGDIERPEGVALVKRYDGEFPERFAEEIFRYLSIDPHTFPVASAQFEQPIMDRAYFLHLADRFRSPHIWKHEDGAWKLRHTVWERTPMGKEYRG